MISTKQVTTFFAAAGVVCGFYAATPQAGAQANPTIPFYGSTGVIAADPPYPIAGESAHITVKVGNLGPQPASNVQVKISYNDWGVTFQGWQEIATVTIPSIAPAAIATAEVDFVFQNSAHTCLEAVIVGADSNTNPDDDRGQINLEVINAGDTFTYYVPVVNHGDEPLNLLLVGCRKFRPGTPNQGGECAERFEDEIIVPPGEEVLVPVHLDLSNVAPGGEVQFVLDAYDNGAGPIDRFLPQNHNHVELRIRKQTARGLKESAVAELNTVSQQVPPGPSRRQIQQALDHVRKALAPASWVNPNQIKKAAGPAVFAQEQAALNLIDHLLNADLPLPVKTALNQIAINLADADRILADTANTAAGGIAQPLINGGDQQRAAGNYRGAVSGYKHAWQRAN